MGLACASNPPREHSVMLGIIRIRRVILVGFSMIGLAFLEGHGLAACGVEERSPVAADPLPSRTIVQVGDYVVGVKDLEQIIAAYPAGSFPSRESKLRLVESLITTK